jgi:hypothetical protein
MRRFFAPDKEKCEAFLRAQKNVAEKKPTKGVSPTGFFRSPSRRKAAKCIQTCYMPLRPFYNFLYLGFPKLSVFLYILNPIQM